MIENYGIAKVEKDFFISAKEGIGSPILFIILILLNNLQHKKSFGVWKAEGKELFLAARYTRQRRTKAGRYITFIAGDTTCYKSPCPSGKVKTILLISALECLKLTSSPTGIPVALR